MSAILHNDKMGCLVLLLILNAANIRVVDRCHNANLSWNVCDFALLLCLLLVVNFDSIVTRFRLVQLFDKDNSSVPASSQLFDVFVSIQIEAFLLD